MQYLSAAFALKKLINRANSRFLEINLSCLKAPNLMFLDTEKEGIVELEMSEFSDQFVRSTLAEYPSVQGFVMTDIASMDVQGRKINYILLKGYHRLLDKGLVYYQTIDSATLVRTGTLLFSNLETNIFFNVQAPEVEESSCNAMETEKVIENGKSIALIIGHMDEARLLYDIERLIYDTVNNVQKHKCLKFEFVVNISKFMGKPSDDFLKKVKTIETYTHQHIEKEYSNSSFVFEIE